MYDVETREPECGPDVIWQTSSGALAFDGNRIHRSGEVPFLGYIDTAARFSRAFLDRLHQRAWLTQRRDLVSWTDGIRADWRSASFLVGLGGIAAAGIFEMPFVPGVHVAVPQFRRRSVSEILRDLLTSYARCNPHQQPQGVPGRLVVAIDRETTALESYVATNAFQGNEVLSCRRPCLRRADITSEFSGEWLRQYEVAEILVRAEVVYGLTKATAKIKVHRAVRANKLASNGLVGDECRIHIGEAYRWIFALREEQLEKATESA